VAIERVAKVLVAVHKAASRDFLAALQQQGILHITGTEESEAAGAVAELDRETGRVEEAIAVLAPRSGQKAGLMGEAKLAMSRSEFEERAADSAVEERLDRVRELNRRLEEIGNRERQAGVEAGRLAPWRELGHVPATLYRLAGAEAVLGRFADSTELDRARAELAGREAAVETVGASEAGVAAVVLAGRGQAEEVTRLLAGMRFETDDLRGLERRPAAVLAGLEEETKRLAAEREDVEAGLEALAAELPGLKARADALANRRDRAETEARLDRTESVLLVRGWVKEREFDELAALVKRAGVAVLARVKPDEEEQQPVALHNPKPFRPFELVLDLYSMPTPPCCWRRFSRCSSGSA
jgi:V/A-type H+-transporting ATPase subunit I